ncbi:MAG TPA: hypothetical protein VGV16_03945 [Gammaproteobacteria bacterium]|nr:hypothetical protein [Gammaproteobacteria bacterium]
MTEKPAPGQQQPPDGSFLSTPPPFWSAAFHVSFLPRVIAWRIAQWRRERGARRHVHIEIPLLIFGCLLLVVLGAPAAAHGSIAGWGSAILGAGALVALMGWSMVGEYRTRRREGYRYDYAVFMPSVFFCCLLLGFTAGLIAGGTIYNDPSVGYLWCGPGLVVGYLAGLFAARWVHALGFMAEWFVYLAILGLVFLPIEDLIVILVYANKR